MQTARAALLRVDVPLVFHDQFIALRADNEAVVTH
jgi:hypothetical protein